MCRGLLLQRGDILMYSLVHKNRFAEERSDNVLCDSAGIFFHDVIKIPRNQTRIAQNSHQPAIPLIFILHPTQLMIVVKVVRIAARRSCKGYRVHNINTRPFRLNA
jgi:hypothetical protein